jgi:hypothetical protein
MPRECVAQGAFKLCLQYRFLYCISTCRHIQFRRHQSLHDTPSVTNQIERVVLVVNELPSFQLAGQGHGILCPGK